MWRNISVVFVTFLRLGLTSFGGPTAHIAAFSQTFVDRLHWLTPSEFAHDSTLCQLVPGPASSQLGMLIGARRAGIPGSIAAFIGFTLPSALLLYGAGSGNLWMLSQQGLLVGLLCGAALVVCSAVWQLAKPMHSNYTALCFAATACVTMLCWATPLTQIIILVGSAAVASFLPVFDKTITPIPSLSVSTRLGTFLLITFCLLLGATWAFPTVNGILYQSGALVFGGGHVVLPMLTERFAQSGFLPTQTITQGYALAQLVPGPLFTLAAFIGTVSDHGSHWGALLGTLAIFLPGWLLILGIQPWWSNISTHPRIGRAVQGTHAAVVGILAASAIELALSQWFGSLTTVAIALVGSIIILRNLLPAWTVPVLCALLGWIFIR